MRMRLVVLLVIAFATAIAATPVQAAMKGCDRTGDAHRADDCITHSHVGATADGNMRPGQTVTIREHIADALRGENLVTVVQARRVIRDGMKSPWIEIRRTRWPAADTTASPNRRIDVCKGNISGRYEFRTSTRLPQAAGRRSARQTAFTVATSAPTTVTLPNQAVSGACPNTPEDEMIVEYFNVIEDAMDIYVEITDLALTDQGASFAVSLQCPPQENPDYPPADFGMSMTLAGVGSSIGCNEGQFTLSKATLQAGGYQGCQLVDSVPTCTFVALVYNTSTQVVYSDTAFSIPLPSGDNTYIPNLNPATLPACPSSINTCALTGKCSLTTAKSDPISLCDSADSSVCTPPPTNDTYAYNENVYFQTALQPRA